MPPRERDRVLRVDVERRRCDASAAAGCGGIRGGRYDWTAMREARTGVDQRPCRSSSVNSPAGRSGKIVAAVERVALQQPGRRAGLPPSSRKPTCPRRRASPDGCRWRATCCIARGDLGVRAPRRSSRAALAVSRFGDAADPRCPPPSCSERPLRVARVSRDDVDDAVDGVGAPERGARPANHLDAIDVAENVVLHVPEDAGEQRASRPCARRSSRAACWRCWS